MALVEGTPGALAPALSSRENLRVSEEIYQLRGEGPVFTLVVCLAPHGDSREGGCDAPCFGGLEGRRVVRFDDPEYYEYLPAV